MEGSGGTKDKMRHNGGSKGTKDTMRHNGRIRRNEKHNETQWRTKRNKRTMGGLKGTKGTMGDQKEQWKDQKEIFVTIVVFKTIIKILCFGISILISASSIISYPKFMYILLLRSLVDCDVHVFGKFSIILIGADTEIVTSSEILTSTGLVVSCLY